MIMIMIMIMIIIIIIIIIVTVLWDIPVQTDKEIKPSGQT